jgi:light-regulated signal transduction histidine kinase (bacteriophytochrome)
MRSFSQLLRQRCGDKLDTRSTTCLNYIEEAAGHLHALVRDLLEYSRTSRAALQYEPVDLQQLVARVADDLSPAKAESHAQLSVGPLPTVPADRSQLHLLLQNLLSNVLKFRGDQPCQITASAVVEGGSRHLSVRDNGIGIDARYHASIFDSFKRPHTFKTARPLHREHAHSVG